VFKDHKLKATVVPMTLSSHKLLTDRASDLIKPCKDAESLLVSITKIGKF